MSVRKCKVFLNASTDYCSYFTHSANFAILLIFTGMLKYYADLHFRFIIIFASIWCQLHQLHHKIEEDMK